METVVSAKLVYALLAPLAGSILVMLTGKRENVRETMSFLAAVTMFGIVLSITGDVASGKMLR